MAIKALDLSRTRTYVSKLDDGDDPTKWHIGTLSSRDKGAIRDSATSFSFSSDDLDRAKARAAGEDAPATDEDAGLETKVERSRMNFEAVRRGLKGWENFLGPDGQPITYKTVLRDVGGGVKKSVVPNELMDLIPLAVIDELASEIMADTATAADAGN
jgi:hypothetical protein